MDRAQYARGSVIIAEGSDASEAYILNRGTVEVYRGGPPEVRLAVLHAGETFGDMALVSEEPRSASVRALEDVEVSVVPREEYLEVWRADPDAALAFIRLLCERVRTLNALVTELHAQSEKGAEVVRAHLGGSRDTLRGSIPAADARRLTIEGVTAPAKESLGGRRLAIPRFPYRIGRVGKDAFAENDLAVPDREPFHVSRSHCAITSAEGQCSVIDRGSRLGTVVNRTPIGGKAGGVRADLHEGDNDIALGGPRSPYQFRVAVSR